MQTTITVHWVAFGHKAKALEETGRIPNAWLQFESEIPPAMFDEEILEMLFHQTNTYSGDVWDKYFKDKMPENRSHTALSVGDKVTIERNEDKSTYVCADFGWELVTFSSPWMDRAKLKAVK
jgi:hypothetical protein